VAFYGTELDCTQRAGASSQGACGIATSFGVESTVGTLIEFGVHLFFAEAAMGAFTPRIDESYPDHLSELGRVRAPKRFD